MTADQRAIDRPGTPAGRAKPKVAIVFGGRSSEHSISCATAAGVLRAIDRDRYDVIPIGITKHGQWVLSSGDAEALSIAPGRLPEVSGDAPGVIVPLGSAEGDVSGHRELSVVRADSPPEALGQVDVVFPLLHGPFGEDGTIQGLFELADLRYVGSGVLASAVMMDKHYMKVVFAGHGIPIGAYVAITDRRWRRDPEGAMAEAAELGFPLFVKPSRAGSSVGISKVDGPDQLRAAVEKARENDPKVVIEAAIRGREIECGVLEGRDGASPRTSRLGEIVVTQGHEFYDFEAKYLAENDVELSCPADVPDDVEQRIRELAALSFDAAGCEGLARCDFFYTDDGEVIMNEINTMPGFTPFSMYPQMWAATGMSYPELITELIELALARPVGLR